MPWRRHERPKPPSSPHAVPDPESVRRAALAASWQRDRRIAHRRLAWRWALWFVRRYFLHILGVLILLLLAGWLQRSQPGVGPVNHASPPASASDSSPFVPVVLQPTQPVPAWPVPTSIPATTYIELPAQELNALTLRMASQLTLETQSMSQVTSPHLTEPTAQPVIPSLKPESWLHSKEP